MVDYRVLSLFFTMETAHVMLFGQWMTLLRSFVRYLFCRVIQDYFQFQRVRAGWLNRRATSLLSLTVLH